MTNDLIITAFGASVLGPILANQLSIYCNEAEINLNRHKLQQEAVNYP